MTKNIDDYNSQNQKRKRTHVNLKKKKQDKDVNYYCWKILGMHCVSCIRKIEEKIYSIEGVCKARIFFSTGKLELYATRDVHSEVKKNISSLGFSLTTNIDKKELKFSAYKLLFLIFFLFIWLIGWSTEKFNNYFSDLIFLIASLIGLLPILYRTVSLIKIRNWLAIEILISISTTAAVLIDRKKEATTILLLFFISEFLEYWSSRNARRGITKLMDLKPEKAIKIRKDGKREKVLQTSLVPGDVIEVHTGNRLPADGTLVSLVGHFDTSAITGESNFILKKQGESVLSGITNIDSAIKVKVTSKIGESTIDRMLHLIENIENKRPKIDRFIDRFSHIYTPCIIVLSVCFSVIPPLFLSGEWSISIYKGITLLLIGCPCALVISTPAAVTSSLASAAKNGILIKGGIILEKLGNIRKIAFDKTGTLTLGQLEIVKILNLSDNMNENTLLSWAAAIEHGSNHPIGNAILHEAEKRQLTLPKVSNKKTFLGIGVEGVISSKKILINSSKHCPERNSRKYIRKLEECGNTVVLMYCQKKLICIFSLQDTLRKDAITTIQILKNMGIQGIILTGDSYRTTAVISKKLGLRFKSELLPEGKVQEVKKIGESAMIGDGTNDAPAMRAATVGIAMGNGTDIALENSDVTLSCNNLRGLVKVFILARAMNLNIKQNIAIAVLLKISFLLTTFLGLTSLWTGILADTGATVLVTLNALRLLK